ncbi:N-acyl-phosphatidylethanolamine-hydrolyzing phospholipase D [Aplysia californica]|uniref:N-acetylphosphatidylethanolamine-hydrolyzing phospholipase D n=1 Tax=Aplysia californica TaxID=6500 RepID=A0ABM1VU21_APLCA|nr:N-acyl-phosphatidylethanolamine-hydrolyzing phospholipase D [Aplysia californica]XP_005099391.1 N-acyl-phosphatidylethanolamine-hydrolyzing phospholipase D [Aplysia californica]XP_035825913.1 N-acyl-phosphatidylethanolamine-hydrolyzing phospholipase D [Aplysia californica]
MAASSGHDSDSEEFSKPIFHNGRYQNPWNTWRKPTVGGLLKFIVTRKDRSGIPKKEVLDETLPVLKPDFSVFNSSPETGIRHLWIGHASSLLQFDGITVLTDPIFSERCSPTQWFGTKRFRPVPCTVEELPRVDCVVISHNHYDHLDYGTVSALNAKFGVGLQWFVPMGLKQWMSQSGCQNVVELSWWEEHVYPGPDGDVRFVCTPSQHWSKRTAIDDNKTLWASWCILGHKHKFHFVGDSGYCEAFKQIGKRYGPFHLSTIPIGAYCPRDFLSPQHVDPEHAVDIHVDLQSQTSIGIHWGTFKMLSCEHYLEPREKVKEELEKRGLSPTAFVTVSHGKIQVF